MKAITLWQPWATLIALGEKKIETRSWSTAHRGALAIHAAKQFTGEHMELCSQKPFLSALTPALARYRIPFHFPRGAIVAVCELERVLEITRAATDDTPLLRIAPDQFRLVVHEPERSFGDYTPGRYAWILKNIRALERPIPCRGYQQLWSVSADIAKEIETQLAGEL